MEEQRLLNMKQAARILGVERKTLYQWRWQNMHLPFVKVGKALRISESDLEKFIKENRVEPKKSI